MTRGRGSSLDFSGIDDFLITVHSSGEVVQPLAETLHHPEYSQPKGVSPLAIGVSVPSIAVDLTSREICSFGRPARLNSYDVSKAVGS